jgi:hypothetical protein
VGSTCLSAFQAWTHWFSDPQGRRFALAPGYLLSAPSAPEIKVVCGQRLRRETSKGCAAGEPGVHVVPPFEFVTLAHLPAEKHDTPVAK